MVKLSKSDYKHLYKVAMEQVHNESQVVWKYSDVYLLANTIIVGFSAQKFNNNGQIQIFYLALIGIFINIIWWGSTERRWAWYEFRMAQARENEKKLGYDLVSGRGFKFSKGEEEVKVDEKWFKLNRVISIFNHLMSIRLLIFIFIIFYLIIMIPTILPKICWECIYSNLNYSFLTFTLLGIVFGVFYSWKGLRLGWNPDYGFQHIVAKVKSFKNKFGEKEPKKIPLMIDRRKIFVKDPPPISWQIERIVQAFMGALFGWWILWFLADKRLNAFNDFKDVRYEWWDGVLFIIGYIGINGRLPTIAHSVQEWIRR